MKVRVGAKSDVGRVRQGNEDSYLVAEPLFAVADGMGGHLAGDVASQTAVEVITGSAQGSGVSPDSITGFVKEANAAIWQKAQEDPQLQGMGTTCTLMLVEAPKAWFAHVGDSRAYLLRGGSLSQITQDHTLVARMVSEGRLRPEEAAHHPQRSIITRALGVDADVDVDLVDLTLEEGDRILLCSDGLSSMLDETEIDRLLGAGNDPDSTVKQLVDAANEAGGEDNITVVVVDITGGTSVDERNAPQPTARASSPATPIPSPAPAPTEGTPPRPSSREERPTDPRHDEDDLDDEDEEDDDDPYRRRGRGRKLFVALLILGLVGLGGLFAARYAMANSWFVGTDEQGIVTIYRGIPESIGGLDLREEEERGSVSLSQVPEYLRDDVERGIRADSLAEARRTLSNIEERSRDFGGTPEPQQTP